MAEEPMLSLFDSDSAFLDDLTNPGTTEMVPSQGIGGVMPGAESLMASGMPGMQQSHMGQQQEAMILSQQTQQGYNQIRGLPQENFRNMAPQNSVMNQQYGREGYNQYGSVPKLHHMSDQMMMGGQSQNLMAQAMPRQQQQQYNSPPSGGTMMQHPSSGYQNFGMSPGPRLPNPQQQQLGMVQNSVWNHNQTSPTHPQYMSQQTQQQQQPPQQQQPMSNTTSQMSPYMPQHDYAMPNACQQGSRLGHYQDGAPQSVQGNAFMQGMASPPQGSRVSMAQGVSPAQPFQQSNPVSSQQPGMGMSNFNVAQQSSGMQPRYPADYMTQGPQVNSGTTPQNKLQHYSYTAGQQQTQQQLSQGMGESSSLAHYPNQSPTSNMTYRPPFPGMAPQRATTPSPRPTPTPPSHTPTHSSTSQGNFGQSSLQQLEQLVPQMGSLSNTNPFQRVMQSAPASTMGMSIAQKPPVYSSSNFQTTTAPSTTGIMSGNTMHPTMGMAVNTGHPNAAGPLSPSHGMIPNQQNVNIEIQRLQQQIQQLYSMPQTQQIQQQMLDLQERVRMLKAQQQQQILQMQQRQQMHTGAGGPGPMRGPQGQAVRGMPGPRPRMPQPQLQQQQQQQQQLSPSPQAVPIQGPQTMTQPTQMPLTMPQLSPTPPKTPQGSLSVSSPQRVQQQFVQQTDQTQLLPTSKPLFAAEPDPLSQAPPLLQAVPQPQVDGLGIETPSLEDHIALSPPSLDSLTTPVMLDIDLNDENDDLVKNKKKNVHQEKADKIIAEAIAKAQAQGQAVPNVLSPATIPATVTDVVAEIESDEKTPKKKKRVRKPKPDTGEKPVKKRKKKKDVDVDVVAAAAAAAADVVVDGEVSVLPTVVTGDGSEETGGEDKKDNKEKKDKKEKRIRTPKVKTPKKKKPPATLLKSKKKRKRQSSDVSDLDLSPPGSPKEEDESLKRRSARNTKRKKYLDDIELNLSDDNNADIDIEAVDGPLQMKTENTADEDAIVVEKILGHRMRKFDKEDGDEGSEEPEEEEEFFVKYKNYSYLHCEWRTVPELEKDKRIQSKIKRYKLKKLQLNSIFDQNEDDEYFNPDYVEVDRVLDMSVTTDPNTEVQLTHYLVKWRGLSYEESTWELQQDVDPKKVELFMKWREIPAEEDRVEIARPKPGQWEKLDETRSYKGGNTLREYQLEGVNWLTFCWYNGQNCILADEMGLGKTIQSITFLYEMYHYGVKGPYLVIVPLSTLGNWQREFETWTDMNVIVYHGTSPSRNMLQEYEMYFKDDQGVKLPNIYRFNALITTYEVILSDLELLTTIEWRATVIDEAHRLKNKNCRLMEGLRQIDIEHRVLLTGTPLQNNTEELFSLLNFLNPTKFNSSQSFVHDFGELKTESQVDELKKILKPMMLRRLKEDVEKNLAPKEETIVEVELTNIQKKYYRAILERNFTFLSKAGSYANVPNLMNTMMELRKCCNHPYLVQGAEDKILEEAREKYGNDTEQLCSALVHSCGKMVLMDKLLPKLKQGGHKVLIFSQMIRVLDILEDYLIQRKYLYERLDGRIRGNLRQEAIDRFSKPESDRFVFLLCTRAGGLGINLTAADTVIIYDSDWNPQNDLQAQARCHRIGQQKSVKVYRLITRNSYEREMFDRASLKLGLDKAVLQSMAGDKGANPQSQMSKKEIEELLKKGAYGALMEDDKAGDEFCEEDIDQILQRRTQVIQIESEGKGSTFAKASFSMTSNRSDIDINDPNFWQKWAKKADIDVDELKSRNTLIIQEPRQRKQTARYGNEDAMMEISDLESSSDSGGEEEVSGLRSGRKGKRGRRRNRNDDDFDPLDDQAGDGFHRSECFKVEKNLLVYGWGRWSEILAHARFKRRLEEKDVEVIAKAILVHSLQFYKGDERIKTFIWDLVSQNDEDQLKNHSGLSAPVPRGRKGKKQKQTSKGPEFETSTLDFDPDAILDHGYKRHLFRHSNKVLLRVRLLYYLKQEVIGDEVERVFQGVPASEIDIPAPCADGELPALWWDEESDRSLLIGVFKHGYEKFNLMRSDPALLFLHRCGPPDSEALAREQNDDYDGEKDEENDLEDKSMNLKDDEDDEDLSQCSAPEPVKKTTKPIMPTDDGDKLPFPNPSELNTRLRRVITGYQRNHKKEQLRLQQRAKKMERRSKAEEVTKIRETKKKEYLQNRWSRREEADFYRTVSTFGVEYHKPTGRYRWDRFRCFARLDKKYDDTLAEYFHAFYHMCQRVCGKFKTPEEGKTAKPPNTVYVDPITEERASRCLARIDLLNKIREEILVNPKLDEHIKLCQPSFDMPSWWQCGKHDKELLIGAARHGVARTDYHILRDPTLSFHEMLQAKNLRHQHNPYQMMSPFSGMPVPGMPETPTKEEKPEMDDDKKPVKSENGEVQDEASKDAKSEKEECSEEEKSADVKDKLEEDAEDIEKVVKDENGEVSSDEDTEKVKINGDDQLSGESDVEEKTVKKEEIKEEMSPEKSEENDEEKDTLEDSKAFVKLKEKVKNDDDDDDEGASDKEVEEIVKEEKSVKEESESEVKEEMSPVKEEKSAVKDEDVKEEEKSKDERDLVKEKVQEIINDVKKERKMEEELMKDNLPPYYGHDESGYLDMDGPEPGEIYSGRSVLGTVVDWPKDRVIFHRLEHICYTVENGEWPFARRSAGGPPFFGSAGFDSRSATPVGSSTPKGDGSFMDSDAADSLLEAPTPQVMRISGDNDKDFEVHVSEGEGLKMTFHKRGRGRKKRYEIDSDRGHESKLLAARVQQLLSQSTQGATSAASSDNESQPESAMNLSGATPGSTSALTESFLNGSNASDLDPSQLTASLIEQGLLPEKRRRGRKRKAEKMAEVALAEAIAKRHQARILASIDPDQRIPVICLEDGSRLSGEEAPRKKDLEQWLMAHPNYIIDQSEFAVDEEEPGEITHHVSPMEHFDRPRGRGRRPRVDPRTLDVESLTGQENVSVVDRETGKKITGAKAPPLKHLAEWLEQNPAYDVEAKWSELVRAKGSLPKSMDSRMLKPSGRGRKPRESMLHPSFLGGEVGYPAMSMAAMSAFPGAGLLGSYPKLPLNLPFGAIPNLGMVNPMLGLAGFGLPGMPMASALGKSETETKEKDSEKGEGRERRKSDKSSSSSSTSTSATPHPSFPSAFYYNPLLYNPMLAAQSLRNFPLPSNMSSSFASMAQHGALNGRLESESEEEARHVDDETAQDKAEDLSVKKKSSRGEPNDLSVKKSSSHQKSDSKQRSHGLQDHATDLSVKTKPDVKSSIDRKYKEDKVKRMMNKPKILGSSKLSKIVDTLKDKVMKIDKKPNDNPSESSPSKSDSKPTKSKEKSGKSVKSPLEAVPDEPLALDSKSSSEEKVETGGDGVGEEKEEDS
ncbi:chromodomain-helicase-DNA-binding protein 8-like isoform X2 [Haliotis cracherodii]|uniref:chromodomain-helicase-DNA-binding protein 8-like isoform X2 n=1 Tax=Haliotis cracherodii TaxID=6455 RepID=UPI0039E8AD32